MGGACPILTTARDNRSGVSTPTTGGWSGAEGVAQRDVTDVPAGPVKRTKVSRGSAGKRIKGKATFAMHDLLQTYSSTRARYGTFHASLPQPDPP